MPETVKRRKPPKHAIGERVGMLVCLEHLNERSCFHWLSRWMCDCGREHIGHVRKTTKLASCGCAKPLMISVGKIKHGHSYGEPSDEYVVWCSMRQRCLCETSRAYPDYGGRGIKICPQWDSFSQFYIDMGPRPSRRHSIDRIDVNGDYEPSNCRWATLKEQARNKRATIHYEVNGERKTFPEWVEISGIKRETVRGRIKRGWSPERAFFEPLPVTGKGSFWRKKNA